MTEAAPGPRRFSGFTLDPGRAALLDPAGTPVRLRPKSFTLLTLLLDNAGRLVTREAILDALWPGLSVTDDSITQCVGEIRRALGPAGPHLLRTVPRRGYILEAVPEEHGSAPVDGSSPPDVADPSASVDARPAGDAGAAAAPGDPPARPLAPSGPGRPAAPRRAAGSGLRTGIVAVLLILGMLGIAALATGPTGAPPDARPGSDLSVALAPVPTRLPLSALAPPQTRSTQAEPSPTPASRDTPPAAAAPPATFAAASTTAPAATLLAEQLYRQGRALAYRADGNRRENWLGAQALFEQAIAADPGFAPAFVEAVFTHTNMATSGFAADPAAELRQAEALSAEAARRAPDRADVQSARGAVLRLQRRPTEALEAYRRAVALDPGQNASRANIGLMLILTGHPDEAAEPVRTALALAEQAHPFTGTWLTYLGIAALQNGEDDHGAALFRQSLSRQAFLPPDTRRLWLAAALALDGQVEEARQLVSDVRSRQSGISVTVLRRQELSDDPAYLRHQEAFYRGLQLSGLPD